MTRGCCSIKLPGCTLCMTRNNPQGPILPLISEIDRLFHIRRRETRANTTMYRGNEPVDNQQDQNTSGIARAMQDLELFVIT
ncbi:hypothetical protein V6N13_073236 [Hibiscus sabdariffa]